MMPQTHAISSDYREQFRQAIAEHGITPPESVEVTNGRPARFPTNGKRGDDSGWYTYHDDGIAAGAFGCWRTGVEGKWSAKSDRQFTPAERAAFARRIEEGKAKAEAERKRAEAERRKTASEIWQACEAALEDHGYLRRKGVRIPGLRLYRGELVVRDMPCDGCLVMPLRDKYGTLQSLEFIHPERPDDNKRYLWGPATPGCYFPIKGSTADATFCVVEGLSTGGSIHMATGYSVAVASNRGNLLNVAKALREKYPEAELIIGADNDAFTICKRHAEEGATVAADPMQPRPEWCRCNPGLSDAITAAQAVTARVSFPQFSGEESATKPTDFNDLAALRGVDDVQRQMQAHAPQPAALNGPEPLPELPAVQPLNYEALPPVLRAFVQDIAERMQCPPDFPAVACLTMIGAAIGRKVGIRPKRADSWTVIANQWAMIVGKSGIMKSPAMSEALKPLRQMQTEAFRAHEEALDHHEVQTKLAKIQADEADKTARALMKEGKEALARGELEKAQRSAEEAPKAKRYIVNDSTVEALAETLEENQNGVLVDRDELAGWLRSLDKEGQQEARAFYLTAADGDKGFTTDRIGRGRGRHIEAVCVSIVGGIQPGVLAGYVRETQRGGSGDDGLMQRFGLAVYPDVSAKWQNVDRPPNLKARKDIDALITHLNALDAANIRAETDDYQPIPFLRFDEPAQILFNEWREELESKIRGDDEHPAIVSHLSKFRKLVPGLALINHLCDGGIGAVTEQALARALTFADYLESHARRIYSYASRPDVDGAKTILSKIRGGKLARRLKARDVYLKGWSGLATAEEAWPAIRLLVDHGYLLESKDEGTGGRPSQTFSVHSSVTGAA